MRSFQYKPDSRRQVYLNLVGSIESQLRDIYAKKYEAGEETQVSLAKKIGVGRSSINHRLRGQTNMTIKTVADMVWGLGQCIEVSIYDPADRPDKNDALIPIPAGKTISDPGGSDPAQTKSDNTVKVGKDATNQDATYAE